MPIDNRGYFSAETPKSALAESATVQAETGTAVPTTAPTPAAVAPTATVVPIAPVPVVPTVVHVSHPALDKFFQILTALEPFLLAAASPFIKNPATVATIQQEAPVAEAITTALSGL